MDLMALVPDFEPQNKREPVVKHDCEVEPEEDVVKAYAGDSGYYGHVRRWLVRQRILSTTHYYAQTCLKSTTAVRREMSQHLREFPYMVHPFSPFRNSWDILMTFFTLVALVITPFLNAFFFDDQQHSLIYIFFIDAVLIMDITLNFFTGYYEQCTKTVFLDRKIASTKYIKSRFIFDLLSAVPVEVFDSLAHGKTHADWYCSTMNFVKIFRMRNLIDYINQFHKAYHLSFHTVKVLKLAIIIIVSLHWSACLVYYVPMLVMEFDEVDDTLSKSWIMSEAMRKRDSKLKKYILSLNRATISLVSSSHYLPVTTTEDMIMNFVLAVFGKIGFIYLLSQFLQLMSTFQSSEKERLKLMQQLQEYMQYKELSRVTQKRLMVYCNYWYKKNFNRDRHILNQVSEPLREQLVFHNYKKLLETVDLFKFLPESAVIQLVNYVKPEIYLASDVIVKSGSQGEHLFFIGSGTVAVYTSLGKEVCHLEDGSYFGEIALVMENEHRMASVVAIETCEILVVPRESFQQVIAPYPNLLSRLQKVALERLEKTLILDEICRLEDPNPNYINISNIRTTRRE
ncbi:potassium/sodium hyperpolarization-activated cyclic nucleotide-gated channel 1-like [Copidosoma floridanum]|uniref:potassium/sodium hyperpolarization-activated cyclic nucleotide-gated channel 1-like n=1 Tax=Copidosoma floridanum TaxID=29053 RepID=UPI0006C9DAA7|nr:potassium/sodium hyperpolarization-activated cyclic nucleotide-gated channel 1-like [Copidosoma floridanum]